MKRGTLKTKGLSQITKKKKESQFQITLASRRRKKKKGEVPQVSEELKVGVYRRRGDVDHR
ncbi:hypothetical protein CCACVL1_23469 [Corchorus capsularis]|uniref:Uncharacterized protein n=1 Tax=Corchorus capsularis TaxID=210143 RepID=A0A1R3GTR9_COCAP|nr:hypothetical protein CCACVL1_23469 [Corchorus capsularis]